MAETILEQVRDRRKEQDKEWGIHDHSWEFWMLILAEEVGEYAKAVLVNPTNIQYEAIDVAAVAVAIAEQAQREFPCAKDESAGGG